MYTLVRDDTLAELTLEETRRVLSYPLRTRMGMDALKPDLTVNADLSSALGAGRVARDIDKTIHGDLTCDLSRKLDWGTALVRPYARLRGYPGLVARAYLGAYTAATPVTDPTKPYAITGYDRLALLNRFLPDTYVVTAGTEYLTAIRDAVERAGLPASTVLLDNTAAGKTLPAERPWPLLPADSSAQAGYTWLNVVNDLLKAIGYRALWTDHLGRFRGVPYTSPRARGQAHAFNTTTRLGVLLGQQRQLAEDTWDLPNQWTFYQRNPPQGSAPQVYQYTDAAGVAKRGGLLYPAQPLGLDAADLTSLRVQGDAIRDRDLLVSSKITHSSSPFPVVEHADVYGVTDPRLGVIASVQSNSWVQGWDTAGVLADTQHGWTLVA